eukprot:2696935-Karenia_brevis.AAC.1
MQGFASVKNSSRMTMPRPRYLESSSSCPRETSGLRMASNGLVVRKGHLSFGGKAIRRWPRKDWRSGECSVPAPACG